MLSAILDCFQWIHHLFFASRICYRFILDSSCYLETTALWTNGISANDVTGGVRDCYLVRTGPADRIQDGGASVFCISELRTFMWIITAIYGRIWLQFGIYSSS